MATTGDLFDAACAQGWAQWAEGNPRRARAILAAQPSLGSADIYAASATGNLRRVCELVVSDPMCATVPGGPRNWLPLLYAAFSVMHQGDKAAGAQLVGVARALLDAGASAASGYINLEDGCNREDLTALYGAVRVGHVAMVEVLAGRGATDRWGNALYTAAYDDNPHLVKRLLAAGANAAGNNVLVHHIGCGRIASVPLLLDAGADPNSRNPHTGDYALHSAITADATGAIARELLARGARVDVTTSSGMSAYRLASRLGHPIADELRARGAAEELSPVDELLGACSRGQVVEANGEELAPEDYDVVCQWAYLDDGPAVRRAATAGIDIDRAGTGDGSPLHDAAWFGRPNAARALIELGAELDSINSHGGSPLSAAVHGLYHCHAGRDQRAVIRLLLDAGAAPDGATGTAWPVRYAAEHGDLETVAMLIEAGADASYSEDQSGASARALLADQGLSLAERIG